MSSAQRMAHANAEPAGPTDAPNPSSGIGSILHKIIRSIAIGLILQAVFKYAGNYIKAPLKVDVAKPDAIASNDESASVDPSQERDYSSIPRNIIPLWTSPATIDIDIYLSENHFYKPDGQAPFISEKNIRAGDWSDVRKVHKSLTFSDNVLNNGSLYAHVYTRKSPGSQRQSGEPDLPSDLAISSVHRLARFMPRRKDSTVKRLIGGPQDNGSAVEVEQKSSDDVISYYHTNFTLAMVGDAGVIPFESIHPVIRPFIVLEPTQARDVSGKDGYYLPIVYENSFWLLKDHMYPINSTTTTVPFYFELNQVSMMRMQVLTSLDQAVKQQSEGLGGSGAEFEEFKRIFLETNVWLLGTTFAVSCLHSLFELLAFKNDIVHFRSKKDNTGVSVNSILMNVIMQTIILLYLLDNQENASWVILIGQGFGIAVEAWKITKSVNVKIVPVTGLIPYRIRFEDKHQLNATEKATKDYDAVATKYLAYASAPLLIMYAVYSVIYEEHKGWWSFIVTTLVSFVYFWGFLTMVPSLWINYKLKSVAHMSTRALGYKFLNTIVDDFFAFIIKQPILSRIAAFRDDVVFVIFIYQAFIYKVDKTRVNEFGQVDEAPEIEVLEEKKVQ